MHPRRRRVPVTVISLLASMLLALVGVTMHTARAGYSDATKSSGMWSTGTVDITDDRASAAMFSTATGPNDGLPNAGQVLSPRCIAVTYTGSFVGGGLSDKFGSQDTAKWNFASGATVSGGTLSITPSQLSPGIESKSRHDFRSRSATVEVPQVPNVGNHTIGHAMNVMLTGTTYLGLGWSDNQLLAREVVDNVPSDTTLPWNATTMRWWQIRSLGTTIYWEHSADGISWTTMRTKTTALALDSIFIGMYASFWGTEPSPGTGKFDNFSLLPNTGVKLYAAATGALAPYLSLVVEAGTGGSGSSCTGFVADTTAYSGALSAFSTSNNNYATGVGRWVPTSSGAVRTYRFSLNVANDNVVFGKSATAAFTWEVQAD